ncbi:FkbM family methyltransferase [Pedobacter sp. KR3-3]|uniref:FkbM family methyltransferase n=1 Tax=Pedobacter albus TaxID=3113905 RepID=A0ABU7I6Z0_9SPHI|nr:FkbM family methyltransferase [Pedobacter sp. KR3-3]MEE1945127.1 FkbM family methyltransferase [Pedobacter sp. KR3-3]
MTTFEEALKNLLEASIFNQHTENNYDELRFGPYKQIPFKQKIKNTVKKAIGYGKKEAVDINIKEVRPFIAQLEKIWKNLGPTDQDLLVHIVAYRLLGYEKIVLPLNNAAYKQALKTAEGLVSGTDTYNPDFLHFILQKFDLKPIGYNIELFFSSVAIAIDFIVEQYTYKLEGKNIVEAEAGDVVLDVGGCWGDTALYFAHKVGSNGQVFSFEFIPQNIKLHNINTSLNPALKSRIGLVPQPVSDVSDVMVYYKDFGPASTIDFKPFPDQTGSVNTISIDDYVHNNAISRVDFIKMDIEGAEPYALKGAINTIRKFRPKLAIAIYHSMNDLVSIPNWILDLDLGYELFLGHYTIHAEETIIFAKVKSQ